MNSILVLRGFGWIAAVGLILCMLVACGTDSAPGAGREPSVPEVPASPLFVEAGPEVGLDFLHENGMSGKLYLPEAMGGGGGFLDYDGDGDLDLYLVQSGNLEAIGFGTGDRLYRNEMGETGKLAFVDVTEQVGLEAKGFGMGLAVGDYDGDGDPDLYLTNFGSNELWRNDGGSFVEVTAEAGVADSRWSSAATWFDFDRDGDLDLFVGNYVDFAIASHSECHSAAGAVDYCGPLAYRPLADALFRNQGDGTFEDVSLGTGIGSARGAALGVVAGDLDGDGWPDLYVANDATENRLWLNQRDGRFVDDAVYAGAAVNRDGQVEGSMGVDAGDYDGDGDLDLFMTHIAEETNTLYANDGRGVFDDVTEAAGLGGPSRTKTGFGAAWLDFDLDGELDLMVANGLIRIDPEQIQRGEAHPLNQANQLFRGLGSGRFQEVSEQAGPAFEVAQVSRGLAVGDVDNDGDPDVLVVNNKGPARLLLNEGEKGGSWLGLRLLSGSPRQDAYGATVEARLSSGRSLMRRVRSDGSYGVAQDPRVLIGLKAGERPVELEVGWPSGDRERLEWGDRSLGRYWEVAEGQGVLQGPGASRRHSE